MVDMPYNLLVNILCTDSSLLIAVTEHGDQTGEQYLSKGRTYVTKALVRIPGSLLTNHRSIWLALSLALETIWSIRLENVTWVEPTLMPRSVTAVDLAKIEPLNEYWTPLHLRTPTRINCHFSLANLSCHLLAQSAKQSIPLWKT